MSENKCKHANIVIMYIKIKVNILVSVFFFSLADKQLLTLRDVSREILAMTDDKITKREKGLSVMAASLDAGLGGEEIIFSASSKEDNKNLLLWHSWAQAYVESDSIQGKQCFQQGTYL